MSFIYFVYKASNLVSDDTNSKADVFIHDSETGETTRVSVASDGTQANSGAGGSSVSADGRYIAFGSYSTNLVDDGNTGFLLSSVFVRDRDVNGTAPTPMPGERFSITGRVIDKDGAPVPDLTISAGFFGSAITDDNGEYIIPNLEPRTYTLIPLLDGYTFEPPISAIVVPVQTEQNFIAAPLSISAIEINQVLGKQISEPPKFVARKDTVIRVFLSGSIIVNPTRAIC